MERRFPVFTVNHGFHALVAGLQCFRIREQRGRVDPADFREQRTKHLTDITDRHPPVYANLTAKSSTTSVQAYTEAPPAGLSPWVKLGQLGELGIDAKVSS